MKVLTIITLIVTSILMSGCLTAKVGVCGAEACVAPPNGIGLSEICAKFDGMKPLGLIKSTGKNVGKRLINMGKITPQ